MVFEPSSITYKTYLDAFPVGPDIPVGELVNELHQPGDNSVQTILWEGRKGGGRHELFRLVYFPFIASHSLVPGAGEERLVHTDSLPVN